MDQINVLRKMTGEQRLDQAIQLSELVRELAIINIKDQKGNKISKRELRKKLLIRLGNE